VSKDRYKREEALDLFWFNIQAFLAAIGNIPKILWPGELPKCKKCKFLPQFSPRLSLLLASWKA